MGRGGLYGSVATFRRTSVRASLSYGTWGLGVVATALLLGTPYVLFAYHSPDLHLVLDSVDTCAALLVAFLVHGRFTRTQRLGDLMLAQGLVLLAVAGLGLTLTLGLLPGLRDYTVEVWLPVTLRVVGAALIVGSAVVGTRRVGPRVQGWGPFLPWLLSVVGLALSWVLRDFLPVALAHDPPASAQRPVISGHPLLVVAHAATAACFFVAAVMFTRRAARTKDELLVWLGPACVLAAFARVNYALFPSLYSGWVYTGDLLRTGFYLLLLVGAAREIRQYWSAQSRLAVLEDRRRLARELHDGVVQELGYIRLTAHDLPADSPSPQLIMESADRALDEARAAVDALGRGANESLGFALHRAARQVAERYGGQVVVDLDDSITADQDQRHALVRITREAVSNAIRHGRATRVRVVLHRDQGVRRLVVQDDGEGFDMDAMSGTTTAGYGLTSMRERAAALPGSLAIKSGPEGGATVEVTW